MLRERALRAPGATGTMPIAQEDHMSEATASVVGVSRKATPGVFKEPQASVTLVAGHGVEGDYHAALRAASLAGRGGPAAAEPAPRCT